MIEATATEGRHISPTHCRNNVNVDNENNIPQTISRSGFFMACVQNSFDEVATKFFSGPGSPNLQTMGRQKAKSKIDKLLIMHSFTYDRKFENVVAQRMLCC